MFANVTIALLSAGALVFVGSLVGLQATRQLVLPAGVGWPSFLAWTAPYVVGTVAYYLQSDKSGGRYRCVGETHAHAGSESRLWLQKGPEFVRVVQQPEQVHDNRGAAAHSHCSTCQGKGWQADIRGVAAHSLRSKYLCKLERAPSCHVAGLSAALLLAAGQNSR